MEITAKSKALKLLSLYLINEVEFEMDQIEELVRDVESEGDLHEDPIAYMIVQDAFDKVEGLNQHSESIIFDCRKFVKENGIMAARFLSALNVPEGLMMRKYIENYPS